MYKKSKLKSATRPRFSPLTVAMLVILLIYAVSLFTLLAWGVLTAFKSQEEFRLSTFGFPKEWVWNFSYVFEQFFLPVVSESGTTYVGLPMMFLYSILYALGCAFFNTLVPCLTSYVCARYRFRFLKMFHTIVIIVMVVPIVGSLPSEIQMAQRFGLYDQIWGLWIMKANFLGMYFLVFYAMFKALPQAYTEAAKIDGAGNFSVMVRIALPLVRNTFLTVMLINFITFWNDYQTPLIFLRSYPTVAYGVYSLANTNVNGMSYVPYRITAAVLMLVPTIILFLCFQKRLLGNLTIGGIKG